MLMSRLLPAPKEIPACPGPQEHDHKHRYSTGGGGSFETCSISCNLLHRRSDKVEENKTLEAAT
jgi:hypothetical protein